MKTIEDLRAQVINAIQLTGQCSHQRRSPSSESVPSLLVAKRDIYKFLVEDPEVAEAHQLLSMVQECLLNYSGARRSLETALKLSGKEDRKALKRLVLLHEHENEWGKTFSFSERTR
ncbi:hypothetical protein ACUHMQ_14465 [Chitinimonas sp. PSY-7]|uniref:hypothetical protein n=1 Tax=Chitinimonas sp. PSY-7 TaxID=3459088 RepID=UPI0040400B07